MNTFSKITSLRQPFPIHFAGHGATSACLGCGARHLGMCDALSDDDLSVLSKAAHRSTIPAGKLIIEEGQPADYFYNVNSGTVRLFKLLPDGRRQITGFATAGHFIALASTNTHMVSAETIDAVQICRFSRATLTSMTTEYPILERKLLDIAIHELVLNQQQLLLLGRKTALEKLATFLLSWWQQQDPSCPNTLPSTNAKLALPLSRTDLADYLGLTIETVSRSLGVLKKNGLIEIPNIHEVILLRPQALAKIAEALN